MSESRYPTSVNPPLDRKAMGVLAILGSAFIWAVEPVLTKLAYADGDFVQTVAIRTVFVALTAAVYVGVSRREHLDISSITRSQRRALLAIAVGAIIADMLFYYALTHISVVNSVIIAHLQPIFIVVVGFHVLKDDRLTRSDLAGVGLMMVAGLAITTGTLDNLLAFRFGTVWDGIMFGATIAWAATAIITRRYLTDLDAGVITTVRFVIAAAAFVVIALLVSDLRITSVYQPLAGVLVAVGYILYYEALKRLKAAQVGALELASPFFAAIIGFLVLGEGVTVMQIVAMVLLVAGINLLSRKELGVVPEGDEAPAPET